MYFLFTQEPSTPSAPLMKSTFNGTERKPTTHVIIRYILKPCPQCSTSALAIEMIEFQSACSQLHTDLHFIFHSTGLRPGFTACETTQESGPGVFLRVLDQQQIYAINTHAAEKVLNEELLRVLQH